jgi:hypothetical protein
VSRDEHRALAGTTAMTLLAIAFACIVASSPASRAGDLQSIELCAGPRVPAHQHGEPQ